MDHQVSQPILTQKQRKFKFFLKNKVYWKCARSSDLAYINKSKPKMLGFLNIANIRLQNIGPKGFKDLCKALADAKMIHEIHLEGENLSSQQLTQILNLVKNSRSVRINDSDKLQKLNQKSVKCLGNLGTYKHFRHLPIMMSMTQEINRKDACHIYQQIKGLNKLKALNLDLPLCNGVEILDYRPQISLKSLHILFRKKVDEQSLKNFASNVQKCHRLKRVALFFLIEYDISHSIWPHPLQNLKNLQEFILGINFNTNQNSKGVEAFFNNFANFNHLTTLELEFIHSSPQFIDSLLNVLFNTIKSLIQLEKLRLKLSRFLNMKNTHLHHIASILQSIKNLQHLTLKLPCIENPNEALLSLFQSLQNLTDLHVLDLTFLDTSLRLSDLEIFFNSLPHQNLTSLKLALGNPPAKPTNIFSTGVEKIASLWKRKQIYHPFSGISRLNNLSTLSLELMSFNNISTQDFKQLSLNLTKLRQLSYLTLTLPQFDPANNFEGLQSLASCFKEIVNLSKLDISFEGLSVQDQEIDIFSSSLIGSKKLKTLRLTVRKAEMLTEKSISGLFTGIKCLERTLDDLLLEFGSRKKFGEKAYTELFQGVIVLKKLKNFKFSDESKARGRRNLENFPGGLKEYQNLKCLKKFVINKSRFI